MVFYFVGQILLLPFNFIPRGFALCDGQELPVAEYSHLFALLGQNFGGDGIITFAVPDYRRKAPAGSNYCIALQGIWPERP